MSDRGIVADICNIFGVLQGNIVDPNTSFSQSAGCILNIRFDEDVGKHKNDWGLLCNHRSCDDPEIKGKFNRYKPQLIPHNFKLVSKKSLEKCMNGKIIIFYLKA